MSPKARSTVKPLTLLPDASPEEQAHARGLNEGMARKVGRIKQEVAKRHALGLTLKKKVGVREKRINELTAALEALIAHEDAALSGYGDYHPLVRAFAQARAVTTHKGKSNA